MIRHGLRSLPVGAVAAAVLTAALLLWAVDRRPWQLWPLVGVAVAALGAAAARLVDEPAAAVVDTLPRALWWRTTARLVPAGLLAAAWVAAASRVDTGNVGHSGLLRVQGPAVLLIAMAAGTALRRRGRAVPGPAVGSAVLLLLTAVALADPARGVLPLFPYGNDAPWTTAVWWWSGLAAAAALLLVVSCVESPRVSAVTM